MKVHKSSVISLERSNYGELGELRVSILEGCEPDIAIALATIRHDLVDEYVFLTPSGRLSISANGLSSAQLRSESDTHWSLSFGAEQLDLFETFTLRAIRDGAAEVDHIDLEVEYLNNASSSWTFTMVFPMARALLSEDEMREHLRLPRHGR